MTALPKLAHSVEQALHEGQVIPAHPLALTNERRLDERRQRALTRYYLESGAGGVAVAVHTTQFEIRKPEFNLLKPVLALGAEAVSEYESKHHEKTVIRIAGICGETKQAVQEAQMARELGYHIGLLSLGGMRDAKIDSLIEHAETVAQEIPLMGFYLQPAVGGRILPYGFWRRFCEIPNVAAIKIAPFNRYQTLDVLRGVIDSGRMEEIALYTGNDDAILYDLISTFELKSNNQSCRLQFAGGLLGHWAFWTKRAVGQHRQSQIIKKESNSIPAEFLALAWQVTDANAAVFDAANQFSGSIAGVQEILYRQGLLQNRYCLNPNETLSIGQLEEIDRIYQHYPHLNDDAFVQENMERWLR